MDPTCLIVCPDQQAADVLIGVLSELGMGVHHVASVARGLELLESHQFDAVILDYRADAISDKFMARWRGLSKQGLLIAVVDSDASARPLFDLGARFVLYRPLSSERTQSSLRTACGVLRPERRRDARAAVSSPVAIACPGKPDMSGFLSNLSDGGTAVCGTDIPNTCKVYFEFSLPGQPQRVRLSGEVAWQQSSGRTGIRFLDVPGSSRRVIQAWLQQKHAPGMPEFISQEGSLDWESSDDAGEHKEIASGCDDNNRRQGQRLACRLGAEVYRLGTDIPVRCVLTDLSEGGCYVEIISPFARKSGVEIVVRTADTKLTIRGQVLTVAPGFGMGVSFEFRDSAEREEIRRLLEVVSASSVGEASVEEPEVQ